MSTDGKASARATGGEVFIQAGMNGDGTQGPEIQVRADGTFWADGKEIHTDEGMRDALVCFGRWCSALEVKE